MAPGGEQGGGWGEGVLCSAGTSLPWCALGLGSGETQSPRENEGWKGVVAVMGVGGCREVDPVHINAKRSMPRGPGEPSPVTHQLYIEAKSLSFSGPEFPP